jgi:hypothetical protein
MARTRINVMVRSIVKDRDGTRIGVMVRVVGRKGLGLRLEPGLGLGLWAGLGLGSDLTKTGLDYR